MSVKIHTPRRDLRPLRNPLCPWLDMPSLCGALFIYLRGRVTPSALFISAAICILRAVELERTMSPIFPAQNQILLVAGSWDAEKR